MIKGYKEEGVGNQKIEITQQKLAFQLGFGDTANTYIVGKLVQTKFGGEVPWCTNPVSRSTRLAFGKIRNLWEEFLKKPTSKR